MPLLPLLPTGDSSKLVRHPFSSPLSNTMFDEVPDRRLLVLTIISPDWLPHSAIKSKALSTANLPVDPFDGKTVAVLVPVVRSLPTNTVSL